MRLFRRPEIPEKPKTQAEKIDKLWDVVTNHIWHRMNWQDMKLDFILILIGIIIALIGVVVALVCHVI